jgi:hypothetical protein
MRGFRLLVVVLMMGSVEFPRMGTALIDGDLGFRQHPFGYTPAPNWSAFLEFAGQFMRPPGEAKESAGAR